MKSFAPGSLRLAAILSGIAALGLVCARVEAQGFSIPFNEVHTVATSSEGVPVEHSFTVTTAGTYQVALTDLGVQPTPPYSPAPLASVQLAVTSGATVVGTPLTGASSMQFSATPGTYIVHVVGAPGPLPGSGPFGVDITNVADGTQLAGASFSDTVALPPTALPSDTSVLDSSFTVTASDTYTVTLTDFKLPQALSELTLALVVDGGALLTTLTVSGSGTSQQSAMVALAPNTTYRIFAIGQASSTVNAGLYAAVVRSSTGAVAFSSTQPVGMVTAFGSVALTAGAAYSLHFIDLGYPGTLPTTAGTSGALVALDDQIVASLATLGTQAFNALSTLPSGGTYRAFAFANPAVVPGTGSYALEILPASGAAALSVAQAVSLPGSAYTAFTFSPTLSSGGNYRAQLADYSLPAALTNVSLAAVQGGASLGVPLTAPGNLDITATSGTVYMLVFAQPAAAGGIFGIDLIPGTVGTPVFQATQGVGAGTLFAARTIDIATAGSYDVTVSDVGFPAPLANLWVLMSSGPTAAGSILGSGKFSFNAMPGTYILNFFAQPSSTAKAGTYSIAVAPTPPPPTVTLSASTQSVSSGGTVMLTWSSTNATSCTASSSASDGWTGPRPTSGTETSAALTTATTFTLVCTAANGVTAQAAVSITITTPPSGSHGGGGGFDWGSLSLLIGLVFLTLGRRRSPGAPPAT